ncbi:MAG: preprotein translocase subunit SecG [Omnitrophica WOR_2 bacterium RIFCSPLOWO2_12_FULL_46_30]|nr:MAG: preprotein translocase subunit SecG [Omnitrophica WOR_2 bacterium RIFCSPLOWO2_12_FULL_46_30]
MLYGILIFIHIFICVGLIAIVLLQAGRGGGLAESFSGAESIFGTKTNAFLTRATMLFAIVFLATCLSLAFLSRQRSRSIMAAQKIITGETQKKEETEKTDAQAPSDTPEKDTTTTQKEEQPAK